MFPVYADKENQGQVGLTSRPLAGGIRTAPVGKSFQAAGKQAENNIPRKALGDVNRILSMPGAAEMIAHKLSTPGSFLKPVQPPSRQPKNTQKINCKEEVKVAEVKSKAASQERPPIEYMPTFDEKDTYEDIWPAAECPGTYAEAFRSWRPASLFPCHSRREDSDDICSWDDYEDRVDTVEEDVMELPEELLSLDELGLGLPPPHELFTDACLSHDTSTSSTS